MPTPKEIEDAIALRKKIKEHGLFRAIEMMGATLERAHARRTICRALEFYAKAGEQEALQQLAAEVGSYG